MSLEINKRVADPIHGTIGLTELECQVMATKAFQRLRNVKQLGLAHYVFPNADYSRFSHSLGVCHVAGRTLAALATQNVSIPDDEVQKCRLAGLCHDIGHYPYSHAMEYAVENHYAGSLLDTPGSDHKADTPQKWMKHDKAGKSVLLNDPELLAIRPQDYWLEIAGIFNREKPHAFRNLISSDLDADRIDYLMRTAHHTGLPYGNVDIEYLLSRVRLDSNGQVCFSASALRAAEHLLMCRYFDYQQVAFNKTVAGLEWLLKEVIYELLRAGHISCSATDVERMISSSLEWHSFDDACLLGKIRELVAQPDADAEVKPMCEAILHRQPPKMVGAIEYIAERSANAKNSFIAKLKDVKNSLPNLVSTFGVPMRHWHVWKYDGSLTKVGATVPVAEALVGVELRDKHEQSLRIHDRKTGLSNAIVEVQSSLMSVLADRSLYALRVYVLLPPDKQHLRPKIAAEVQKMDSLGWV